MRAVTGSVLAVLVGMALLTGCSSPSVITLNDGREIQTLDQPEYDDEAGFYEFEGIDGKPGRVNKDQVRTVQEL
ncbi:YgdI/YgdR family lipoprotein [Pseudomonas sp. 9Ag]|jgi:major membrane immunogen (membrane-anchored lipoprotein)|uniref:YgdI/YgdR family lipoprotein n=1 Tax=Pseudomonas sp. 9Ag TaxID=2653167 RepID=UPI0012F100A6|nr:YgdI/YgdR family lipoprotein [Pseudomonas sp. 9Ag]VXC66675.1 YgdI/YgdR family lipoprotein [Pseudomonas sp. 9Ag]